MIVGPRKAASRSVSIPSPAFSCDALHSSGMRDPAARTNGRPGATDTAFRLRLGDLHRRPREPSIRENQPQGRGRLDRVRRPRGGVNQFNRPAAVAVDRAGRVYVANSG